jgi:hypothetical protein
MVSQIRVGLSQFSKTDNKIYRIHYEAKLITSLNLEKKYMSRFNFGEL